MRPFDVVLLVTIVFSILVTSVNLAHGATLDDFESLEPWSAHPADGVQLELISDTGKLGQAIRLDFRFTGGGYAIARRELSQPLSGNYEFRFWIKGDAPSNHIEFKLIDPSGENVWWHVRRDVEFSGDWEQVRIKKRMLTFAWGPKGGGGLDQAAALEFAITAGSGGEGRIWIDQLELVPLPPEDAPLPDPILLASSSQRDHGPASALDGDPRSFWSPRQDDASPWLLVDFSRPREFSALILDWKSRTGFGDYQLEASFDSLHWTSIREVLGGAGSSDRLYLPDSEARFLRFRFQTAGDQRALQLTELRIQPVDWAESRERFFEHIASEFPRGRYPRGFSGEQSFWTLVGLDGGRSEGLLGEDGALEIRHGSFSVEPFLHADGHLVSWADVQTEQSLHGGRLPIPSVSWIHGDLELSIQATALGRPDASALLARYRMENHGPEERELTLYLAIRPFQVNPPSQSLNRAGGTSSLTSLEERESGIWINDLDRVITISPPSGFGCLAFDAGAIVADHLEHGSLPDAHRVEDPFGAASGALSFVRRIPAGETVEISILLPQSDSYPTPDFELDADWVDSQFEASIMAWEEATRKVTVELPKSAAPIEQSLYAQLGYLLVNRDGPAIQPGSRSYARSWIRDGTLSSTALLRLQRADVVREFLQWYAGHQYENGKIPCVVDHRGADPVPEHDSNGEFIHLVAEYHRHTRDTDLTREMWPRVQSAVAYLDSLRHERLGPGFDLEENAHLRGILPPSISHEGYAAKPMHSYWDDFFAYLGFKDAVYLATELREPEHQSRYALIRDEFAHDLASSVEAAVSRHAIDYVPGCADLGDFDATSTTIAFAPTGAADLLPAKLLESTFQRYYEFFRDRLETDDWRAFTPYEIRNVGAFLRLGWRDRAHELLEFFLTQQKPRGWRQWPEVVFREDRIPHFLGDLPHTWVGSDYIRSVLDLFAYEEDGSQTLIVGAGVPQTWLEEDPGVRVRGLSTAYGFLDLSMRRTKQGLELRIDGLDRIPPGGIIVRPPLAESHPRLGPTVDCAWEPEFEGPGVVIHELPATLIWAD